MWVTSQQRKRFCMRCLTDDNHSSDSRQHRLHHTDHHLEPALANPDSADIYWMSRSPRPSCMTIVSFRMCWISCHHRMKLSICVRFTSNTGNFCTSFIVIVLFFFVNIIHPLPLTCDYHTPFSYFFLLTPYLGLMWLACTHPLSF